MFLMSLIYLLWLLSMFADSSVYLFQKYFLRSMCYDFAIIANLSVDTDYAVTMLS